MTWKARGAMAIASGVLVVVASYALLRAFDVLFRVEPNPATLVASVHIAMFWRLAVGSYAGGAVAFGSLWLSGRQATVFARGITWAIPIVAALVAVQGSFLP